MGRAIVLVVCVLGACGDDKTSRSECDQIADDIRKAANLRGIPSQGVCSSSNVQIQRDFGEACRQLKDCQDRCCDD